MLLAAALSAEAGWNGFPLASNTNATSWYELRQTVTNPVEQVFNAIDERYRAAYGARNFTTVHATPYGGTSSNYYMIYRPILTQTVVEDLGSVTSVVEIADGLYDAWGWWEGYEEPDSEGRYYVFWNDAFQWIRPLYVTNDGFSVFIPGITFTNVSPAYTNITYTNRFGAAPVTRATLATLWDYIGAIAPEFMSLVDETNAQGYVDAVYRTFTPSSGFPGDSYSNSFYTVAPYYEPQSLGGIFDGVLDGFGWLQWRTQAVGGGGATRLAADSYWVEGGFKEPLTTTQLAAARAEEGAWVVSAGGYAPSYVPEWFWLGDTNAPLARWEYHGTGTPPASVTVSGSVWQATWYTNTPAIQSVPPGGWPPWSLFAGAVRTPVYLDPPKYGGKVQVNGVVEVIANEAASTNIWKSLAITAISGGAEETNAVVTVVWPLHHLAPYRLYVEEFDRMYTALNAMRVTVNRSPGYSTIYRTYNVESNGTWNLASTVTNALRDCSVNGSSQDNGDGWEGHYDTAETTVEEVNLYAPTNATYTSSLAAGWFLYTYWWYDWGTASWRQSVPPLYETDAALHIYGTGGTNAYVVTIGEEPPLGTSTNIASDYWNIMEWNFDYHEPTD